MDKLEVSPRSVRGYGNIIIPKLSTDFVGKYNEIYTDEDGYFVLSYGGVMLKASATVSNTIKGIQASLTVLVSTRDSDTPVSGLSVDCSVDSVALTGQTTDSAGKCTFTWTPSALGDSSLVISVSPQDDYAGLSLDKTVTVGLLLGFDGIMASLSLEDDEVYSGTFEEDVEDRSQLSEFVKDVWVASGGEPIVDEYGIIHICEAGDLVVESEGLEQLPEYSNVLFEGDVDLLTGAVYDMSITEDYEIVLDCLERSDIVPDVPPVPPSYDGITLTSDKNILSYADSDTCTLTAQLTDDGSPVSVEGVTVEFFKGSTSLGTADTNSSGVATKTYASAGSGDVSFTAEADSIISSEIYVEDCLIAQLSETTVTNSSGTKISSIGMDTIPNIQNTNFKFEFDGSGNGVLNVGSKSQWSSTGAAYRVTIGYADGKNYWAVRTNSTNEGYGSSASTSTEYHYKLEREGTTVRYYVDGTLIQTRTGVSFFTSYDSWSIYSIIWGSGTQKVKNIKIKPL